MAGTIRLNKHLAHTLGISRREADNQIERGRILINGKIATLGNIIDPTRDKLTIDSQPITNTLKRYSYVLMNKPIGYICSRKQQGLTPTIYDLLPRQLHHLKVAGRLDKDSCGLILLTDDGDTIFKLTHPKFGKEKVYFVGLNKPLKSEDKKKIESGVELEDGASKFTVSVIPAQPARSGDQTGGAGISKKPNMYKVTMSEGRNRQIRRTFGSLRYMVTHLERQSFGPYRISQLNDKTYLQI